MNNYSYVLITPAYNEGYIIQKTIESIINQSVLPLKWIIVDDGSADNTLNIAKTFSDKCGFIDVISIEKESKRTFASKVRAFNYGFEKIKNLQFDFIGNLDAEITFEPDYYEKIISEFKKNERLGVAGGDRYDLENGKFERVLRSSDSVSGVVLLFWFKC